MYLRILKGGPGKSPKLLYFELSPPQKDTLGIEVAGVVKTYTSSCGHCIELKRQVCEVLYRHAHLQWTYDGHVMDI